MLRDKTADLGWQIDAELEVSLTINKPRSHILLCELETMLPGMKVKYVDYEDIKPQIPEGTILRWCFDRDSSKIVIDGYRKTYNICVLFMTDRQYQNKGLRSAEDDDILWALAEHPICTGETVNGWQFFYDDSPKELRKMFRKAGFVETPDLVKLYMS
jgi:hypothetical protein